MKITPPVSRARSRAAASVLSLLVALSSLPPALAQGTGFGDRGEGRRPARAAQRTRTTGGQGRRETTTGAAPSVAYQRPRLVLLIAVDQFRYDFLERFADLFVAGGLRRLQREGASWTQADYDHVPTETAPGHATMMTGAWPAETGIIGNEWYDRTTKKTILNVLDEDVRQLGGGPAEKGASPRNLLASTLGDELKLVTAGRSKVIGIAGKDRGAILPAGRAATAAYWYSPVSGEMVSSTYYRAALPEWVTRFNVEQPAKQYFGKRWERLLPAAEYEKRAGKDDPSWETDTPRLTRTFPHVVNGGLAEAGPAFYGDLRFTPFANDLLVSFAEAALVNESLGADADTDVLTVGLSASDYVGHQWGPYSHESMDMTLHTDRQIATLLDMVDRRVGLRNTLVAFTADHGVAPVPEHAAAMKLSGGRLKPADVMNAVCNAVRARFGGGECRDGKSEYVVAFDNNHIYFDHLALRRERLSQEEVERVAGEAALSVPGIARFFTRTQLATRGISPADPVARRVLHGFNAARSGDVVVVQEPFKYLVEYSIVATHGAPYSYDTHVPVIIMGGGVNAGRYTNPATPADIAPTLAALLRVQPPSNAVGRVLSEALK